MSGLFIHGRTKTQGYRGTVDYNIIREVKKALKIPVIASGDALTPELIKKMFDETGCDGVAVARGALGNPWIFSKTAEHLNNEAASCGPDMYEIARTMKEHLDLIVAFRGEVIGVMQFRKFFSWYLRGMSAKELKLKAFHAATREEMMRLIGELETLKKNPPCSQSRGGFSFNYSLTTLIALGPFGPFSVSKLTESPSARLLKPLPWIDVWCTNASLPSSHAIKPKPLVSLNHFTVP